MLHDHYYKVPVNKECRPSVVDDITVKHIVIDDINSKLRIIEAKITAVMMAQGNTPPSPMEDRLLQKVKELEKELVEAYRVINTQKATMGVLRESLADATKEILEILELRSSPIQKECGGTNSYQNIRVDCGPNSEMTTSIRTNIQEIANSNSKIEMLGNMYGKWLLKKTSAYFLNGLYKVLREGIE